MKASDDSLAAIFEGWDGYQISLLRVIQPLTRSQLAWRPGEKLRSTGEIALMLGMQGLPAPDLGDLGGHLTEPPVIQN